MLTRAYSACILANIAFLQQGQVEILHFGGVSQLVRLISRREDRKVVLHCVAALQNLTYKNSDCCFELLEQGKPLLLGLSAHPAGAVCLPVAPPRFSSLLLAPSCTYSLLLVSPRACWLIAPPH